MRKELKIWIQNQSNFLILIVVVFIQYNINIYSFENWTKLKSILMNCEGIYIY